jgi:hypothetical protein
MQPAILDPAGKACPGALPGGQQAARGGGWPY